MWMEYLKAFLVGGAICAVGQVLIDYTKLTPARILVAFVCMGVVLGGLGLYQPLIDFAGAGASVPLTGFGALLAKGTLEAIREDGLSGVISGGIGAAGAGLGAAIVFGLMSALIFKPGDKM